MSQLAESGPLLNAAGESPPPSKSKIKAFLRTTRKRSKGRVPDVGSDSDSDSGPEERIVTNAGLRATPSQAIPVPRASSGSGQVVSGSPGQRLFNKTHKSAKRSAENKEKRGEETVRKRVGSYCTCKVYNMRKLRMGVLKHKTVATPAAVRFEDSRGDEGIGESSVRFGGCQVLLNSVQLEVMYGANVGHVMVSPFGCVVMWGTTHALDKLILDSLRPFEREPNAVIEMDEFVFIGGDKTTVKDHVIVLEHGDNAGMARVVVSHAISQSAKIAHFEERVEDAIENMEPIAKELQLYGKLSSVSTKRISKQIGTLFLLRSQVNFGDIADAPAFLWDLEALEHCHEDVASYLDIAKRILRLNHRMDTLGHLYEILRDETNNRHSVKLEWIVIVLVGIECVLGVLPYILESFH